MDLNKTLIVHILINNEQKKIWNSMYEKNIRLLKLLGYSNTHLLEYSPHIANNLPIDYYKTIERAECFAALDQSLLSQYDYFIILDIDSFLLRRFEDMNNLLKDFDQPALMFFNNEELKEKNYCNMSFGLYSSSFLISLIDSLKSELALINSMSFKQYMSKEFLPYNDEILRKVSKSEIVSFDKLFFNCIFQKYNLTGIFDLNDFVSKSSSTFVDAHIMEDLSLSNLKLENKFNRPKQKKDINKNIKDAYFIHFSNEVKEENKLIIRFINKNILPERKTKKIK